MCYRRQGSAAYHITQEDLSQLPLQLSWMDECFLTGGTQNSYSFFPHFPKAAEDRLINMGVKDWKHLPECCSKHEASRVHAACMRMGKMDGFTVYKFTSQEGEILLTS